MILGILTTLIFIFSSLQSCKSNYKCASFELGASCFSDKGGMGGLGEYYQITLVCFLYVFELNRMNVPICQKLYLSLNRLNI